MAAATSLGASVWRWQPVDVTWFEHVRELVPSLRIDSALGIGAEHVRAALHGACEAHEAWLVHPALGLLWHGDDTPTDRLARELLLVVWTAAHRAEISGPVAVSRELVLWTPDGPRLLAPGDYILTDLARAVAPAETPWPVQLDFAGAALGATLENAWSVSAETEVRSYLAAMSLLQNVVPDISAWVARVTKVVVPLPADPAHAGFRSSSPEDVPGVVRMDLSCGSLRIIEGLVHESAHRYVYHLEAGRPLVASASSDRRFPSPLKKEPRPLRSVLLAYHALAYICAAFTDLLQSEYISDRDEFVRDLDALRETARRAGATCADAAGHLTAHGAAFLERVQWVERYAVAR